MQASPGEGTISIVSKSPLAAAPVQLVGKSPKAIAVDLNSEGVPGPLGRAWGDASIRGHRLRGTGIINNELYAGVLVWNRQRFIKDPATSKRVSRINPESDWIRVEVPHLRIVDDALWTGECSRYVQNVVTSIRCGCIPTRERKVPLTLNARSQRDRLEVP